jgi:hypothetical protein
MSRDSQRYRKTYSYYRVQPKTELLEVIVDETLDWKKSVRACSTESVSLTGSTPLVIDNVTLVDEDRVLLKDQGDGAENGIYYYEVEGSSYTLTRASDARQDTLSCGAASYVEEGTANSGGIYILSTTGPIAVGTTSQSWTQLSGGGGGGVGGSGTSNYVSKFTASSTVGNSSIYDDGTNVGIGTNSFSGRFYISGSSSASQPTLVIKGGAPSPTTNAGLLDVQNSAGTSVLFVTGTLATIGGRVGIGTNRPSALLHVSGTYAGSSHGIKIGEPNIFGVATNTYTSLQHTFYGGDGSTLRLTLDSNGNILAGGSLGFASNTARLYITGSSSASGQGIVYKAGVASPTGPLLDIKDYSGNSIVFVSGSGLSGSLTKLTDGTSYLIAGSNVTITTGSSGAVTIATSGGSGPTGSGTDGYLTRWTGSSTLGDSFIKDRTPEGLAEYARYYKNYNQFEDQYGGGTYVWLYSNSTTGGRIGINNTPSCALDIIAGSNSINEAIRVRNNYAGEATGLHQTFIAGNFSEPTFRITHAWPSNVEGHYTFFGITKPTQSAGTPSIAERLKLYSSGSVEVSGSLVARLDPEIINKPVISIQKSNGREVLWVSSSAGNNSVGSDVFMWVSGSRTDNNSGADKVVFGGDVRISGSLSVGTGSVFVTANDIQFGSSAMRIQKNGNDMKFFDVSNPSGYTLTELAAGGGGGGSSPEYWTSPSSGFIYATGSVGIGSNTNDSSYRLNVYQATNFDDLRVKFEQAGADYSSKLYLVGGNSFIDYGDPYGAPTNEISSLYRDKSGDLQRMWRVWGGLTTNNMTFDTGDVEAMRINASQSVGIGTTTVRSKLHVFGNGQTTAAITDAGDRGSFIRISHNDSSQGSGGGILFTNYQGDNVNSVGFAAIKGLLYDGSGNTAGDLAISTRSSTSSTSLTERLRITYDGKVGIGNTAPTAALDVSKGNGIPDIRLSHAGTAYMNLYGGNGVGALTLLAVQSEPLVLGTGNAEKMRITSGGNVGIGTAIPGARLHIGSSGYGGSTPALKINHSDGSGYGYAQFGDSATSTQNWHMGSEGDGSFRWYSGNWGSGTELMRINSSGKAGIGTTNPQDRFVVGTTSYTANQDGGIRIQTTDGSVVGRIAIKTNGSVVPRFVIDAPAADDGTYSEVMSMWDGKVGIGTTSPSAALDVNKSGGAPDIRLSHAGTTYMNLYGGSGVGALNLLAVQNEPLVFGTNNTERMRISATGNVGIGTTGLSTARVFISGSSSHSGGVLNVKQGKSTHRIIVVSDVFNTSLLTIDATGSLGLGTTDPGDKMHVVGGNVKVNNTYGVDFSDSGGTSASGATTTSHILKDYEEGTWTPVFSEDGGSDGTPGATNQGSYVKIGRKVTATCRAVQSESSASQGSGQWIIKGLPYSCGTSFGAATIGFYSGIKASIYSLYGLVENGYDHVKMYVVTSAGGSASVAGYTDCCDIKGSDIVVKMVITYQV